MTAGNGAGPPGYVVTYMPRVGNRLRTWGAYAIRHGLGAEYARALRAADRRLRTDPGTWGDPVRDRPASGLQDGQVMGPTFVLYFGVHEASRTVFVRDVWLNPYSDLAERIGPG